MEDKVHSPRVDTDRREWRERSTVPPSNRELEPSEYLVLFSDQKLNKSKKNIISTLTTQDSRNDDFDFDLRVFTI